MSDWSEKEMQSIMKQMAVRANRNPEQYGNGPCRDVSWQDIKDMSSED